MKTPFILSAALVYILGFTSATNAQNCKNAKTEMSVSIAQPQESETMNIVDTAAGNEMFSTLVAAVKAADLVEALKKQWAFYRFRTY